MAKHKPVTASITHTISENWFRTTVRIPGQKPISKKWVRAKDGHGHVGLFERGWDDEPTLDGFSAVLKFADEIGRAHV